MAIRIFRKISLFGLLRILFLLLVFSPVWSYIWWVNSPSYEANITMIDKTVPTEDYFEHVAFNWIMNYEKLVQPGGRFYLFNQDYFGFDPSQHPQPIAHDWRNYSRRQLDSIADTSDMFYITDTYGVYYNEWILDTLLTEHSPLIYGGLKRNEIYVMEKIIKADKPLWAEFNTFASPTGGFVRRKAERLLNVEWSGWTGRYFDELDSGINEELPKWLINGYMEQHGGVWPFEGEGLAMVSEGGRVEIFDPGKEIDDPMPFIEVDEDFAEYYDTRVRVPYPFWFEVTHPEKGSDAEQIGRFYLNTLPSGDSLLATMGITNTFPAMIRSREGKTWYFCADFADNLVPFSASYFKGIHWLDFLMFTAERLDRSRFFWHFYRPMVTRILEDYGFIPDDEFRFGRDPDEERENRNN